MCGQAAATATATAIATTKLTKEYLVEHCDCPTGGKLCPGFPFVYHLVMLHTSRSYVPNSREGLHDAAYVRNKDGEDLADVRVIRRLYAQEDQRDPTTMIKVLTFRIQ